MSARGTMTQHANERELQQAPKQIKDSSNNMAETLAEINCKLDLALAWVIVIEEIKVKQHQFEKKIFS